MNDTVPALHTTDGLVNEWPAEMFHPDNDTTVFTAIDNDNNNLYAVLTIPEFFMQMKLMRNGMKLFIDLKAKQKTSHGVEFPISEEVNNFVKSSFPEATSEEGQQNEKKESNKKLVRQIMSLGMVSMKIFGLTATGAEQGLTVPGSINIAFKWDINDMMHIEYSIPLKLLNLQPADKTEMNIGWTISGGQQLQHTNTEAAGGNSDRHHGEGGGHSGGMNGFGGSRGGTGFNNTEERSKRKMSAAEMMKEQTYWSKYTLVGVKKAF